MATTFSDRVSTYPNRYKIVQEGGATVYATLERADSPTAVGTPLNAATLNAAFADKAPAGYGLGETIGMLETANCNNAIKNGWYYVRGAANAADSGDHVMLVASYGNSAVHQIAFLGNSVSANTFIKVRKCYGSNWSDWEWLNPPVASGVEYRTTERWGGRPVYVKMIQWTSTVDFIGTVNASVPHGISNIDVSTARIEMTSFYSNYDQKDGVSSAWVFPYYSVSPQETLYVQKITDAEIKVRSEAGANWDKGRTFYFTLKYCKK